MKNIINEKPQINLSGRLQASFDFVNNEDLKKKTILDIGCGYGWFELNALKSNPKEIYSCEVTEEDLSTIRKNVDDKKVHISVADATDLKFEEKMFDTVVCWEVIEHIPNNTEGKFFSEINKVLKSGGTFYLSTPYDSLLSKLFDPAWLILNHRHYSVKKLVDYGEKYGFVTEKVRIFGSYWLLLDIVNMYFSKWILRRTRIFKNIFDKNVNTEYQTDNGFVNIFIKFRKN